MKDIHSHILFGIDDGSSDIEESVYIIKELSERGFTDIILTPHYIEETNYNADNQEKETRLSELKKALEKENINIHLYIGNEVFISSNINELIKKKKISSLANSKYILIEYSLYNKLSNDKDILLDLIESGYTPVLAHPERYEYYKKDINYFKDLVKSGVLLQGNLMSLLGNNSKQLVNLLKEDLIHFLSTDIHKKEDIKLLDKALIQLDKTISKEKQKELLDININEIIKS